MKCEICHEREAETVFHRKDERGEDEELYVCRACAEAATKTQKRPERGSSPRGGDNGAPTVSAVFSGSGEPPGFVKDLVEATLGFMNGMAQSEKKLKRVCPACKRTWSQVRETEEFGCPECWKAFAHEIRETFLGGQYGAHHVGEMPNGADAAASRALLKRKLKDAIAREEYERAADIRRQLDELDERAGGEKDGER